MEEEQTNEPALIEEVVDGERRYRLNPEHPEVARRLKEKEEQEERERSKDATDLYGHN